MSDLIQEEIDYLLTLPTNSTYSEWSLIGSSCQHIHREYISNDDFLLILHLVTLVSTVFNVAGVYCIVTQSSVSMGNFKWCLANLQFWIAFTDLWVTVFVAPRFYFPTIGGIALGLFFNLGLTVPQLIYLGFASFGCMVASVFVLFLYRHQVVVPSDSFTKFPKSLIFVFVAINYLVYGNMTLPAVLTAPYDQISEKVRILRKETCPPKDILNPDVFLLQSSYDLLLPYVFFLLFFVGTETLTMSLHCAWRTRKMQLKFLLALIAQVAIPTALCYAPVIYCLVSTLIDHYNQFANDICVFVFVTHGIVSSTCLLFFYDCYFDYISFLICRNRSHKKISMVNFRSEMFHKLLYLGGGCFGCVISSVFVLFLYRHQVIVPRDSFYSFPKRVNVGFVAINYLLYGNMAIPAVLTAPSDQVNQKIELLMRETCPPKDILDPDVYLLQVSYELLLPKTRKMQIKFLLALTAQIAIPTTLCYAPIVYCLVSTLIDHYNQFANDICVFVFITHGIISSTCLLLFYECYLDHIIFLICRRRTRSSKVSVANSRTDPISRKSIVTIQ
ncbi:unnamed protein product [Caenorhabditis angaria]|uniref:Uncharacterized protein n=1 Tax=Caenorhabditis angaria TaxID=860376 RepID=A0A9P1N4X0_9PELO|nr:unnamed protein product [Caenorhabditis angaria]